MTPGRVPAFARQSPLTRAVFAYVQELYRGQRREVDGASFTVHPVEVASLLYSAGAPDHVVAAGVLHDVIEDSAASAAGLRLRVGDQVTELVLAVSEDELIADFAARKAALRDQVAAAGKDALFLSAADKISKVRELRIAAQHGGGTDATRARRLEHYERCLELLSDLQPQAPLVQRLRVELDELRSETARPARSIAAG
jgi:(p)ppGpp synthase/HD superfamily hydrolase